MLTLLFTVLLFLVFGKILIFSVKAEWGISKIVCAVVLLPLVLIGLVFVGLIKLAVPVLLILGAVSLVVPKLMK